MHGSIPLRGWVGVDGWVDDAINSIMYEWSDTAVSTIESNIIQNREHIVDVLRKKRKTQAQTSKNNSKSVRTVAAAAVSAGVTFGTAAHVFV
jgi:hypothetical protein